MNRFSTHIHEELADIRLTAEEKNAMRAVIHAYMRRMPAARAVSSPYAFLLRTHRFAGALAGLLIIVLVSGGTAFAAQGALPGDILYPVKINVNEKVAEAFATGDAAKAEFHAQAATERVKEAEQLAARGDLTSQTAAQLQSNFDSHIALASTLTQKLESKDAPEAAQISATLGASLDAHGAVLAALQQSGTSTANSAKLAQHVRDAGDESLQVALAKAPAATAPAEAPRTLMKVAGTSGTATAEVGSPAGTQVAQTLKDHAAAELAATKNLYTKAHDSLSATTTTAFDLRLTSIQKIVSSGDAALAAGDTEAAIATYRDAIQQSAVLEGFLTGDESFRTKLLPSLLLPGGRKSPGNQGYMSDGNAASFDGSAASSTASTSVQAHDDSGAHSDPAMVPMLHIPFFRTYEKF